MGHTKFIAEKLLSYLALDTGIIFTTVKDV
jgi:hypothetical protein